MSNERDYVAYGPTPNDNYEPVLEFKPAPPLDKDLTDEAIKYVCGLCSWDVYEALFYLDGKKSLGLEYHDDLRRQFPNGLELALEAADAGRVGKEIQRAGQDVYIDTPKNWLAWADSQNPQSIPVSGRVREAIQASRPS